jgi:hypothetical protein
MSALNTAKTPRVALIAAAGVLALGLSGLVAAPAMANPTKIVLNPKANWGALALGDDIDQRLNAFVLDETGATITSAGSAIVLTYSPDCDFPTGQAPSLRTCTITAAYGELPDAQLSLQIFDLSVLSKIKVTVSNPVIAPGVVATVEGAPADWPALEYTWSAGGRTVGSGPSYQITMADIGGYVSVSAALKHASMNVNYRAATVSRSTAAQVGKVNPVLTARLTAATVNTKRRPTIDVSLQVPGVGPWSGPMAVTYGTARLETSISGGRGRIALPKLKVGTYPVTVWYLGDTQANMREVAIGNLKIVKPVTPKLTASLVKASVKRTAKAKVKVKVTAKGVKKPTGTVTVSWGKGKGKSASFALKAAKKGKATFTLPKIKKKGTYKIKIVFTGNGKLTSASANRTLKVR